MAFIPTTAQLTILQQTHVPNTPYIPTKAQIAALAQVVTIAKNWGLPTSNRKPTKGAYVQALALTTYPHKNHAIATITNAHKTSTNGLFRALMAYLHI